MKGVDCNMCNVENNLVARAMPFLFKNVEAHALCRISLQRQMKSHPIRSTLIPTISIVHTSKCPSFSAWFMGARTLIVHGTLVIVPEKETIMT